MRKIFNNFIKNDKGAVWTIVGISIVTLMIFIGVAIDMGRYFLVRNKILSALDAGLIAAADISTKQLASTVEGQEEIRERGRQFFRANFPANYLGTQIDDSDIVIDIDANTGSVSGEIDGAEMPLVFAGIFGLANNAGNAEININVFSEVLREVGAPLEIALVLDYTPSMCFAYGTGSMWGRPRVVDPTCAKFNDMTSRAVNFINQIQSSINANVTTGAAAYYSFVPFTHTVRINNSTNNLNFCFPENQTVLPSAAGLSDNPQAIISLLENSSAPKEGGSNMAAGMWWGWNSLRNDPSSQNLFVGSSAKTAPAEHPETIEAVNNFDVSKILILLTDGENEYPNYRCDSNPPRRLSGDAQGFTRDLVADSQFLDLCQRAKAEGILVYTIAFDVPSDPNVTTRGLLTSCANPGQSYNAGNRAELERIFGEIANDVIDLRITK